MIKKCVGLRWEWEYPIPELSTSIFVIPSEYSKNKCDRLVVLNDIALQVINEVRGQHPVYVFTGKDGKHRIHEMNNYAWKKARKQLNIPVRIHDLQTYLWSAITRRASQPRKIVRIY